MTRAKMYKNSVSRWKYSDRGARKLRSRNGSGRVLATRDRDERTFPRELWSTIGDDDIAVV